MKMVVCSIFDQAAKAYGRPIFVTVVGMAIRAFQDEVNNEKSPMYKHPDQYVLFEIGTFDDNTGEMTSIVPVSLGNGMQYKDNTKVLAGDSINSLFLAIQRIEERLNRE